jgi:hypothetical protein
VIDVSLAEVIDDALAQGIELAPERIGLFPG